jgi:phenylpyruvate tautomerase PptA (4-oxalocrotonate tautomerase family)
VLGVAEPSQAARTSTSATGATICWTDWSNIMAKRLSGEGAVGERTNGSPATLTGPGFRLGSRRRAGVTRLLSAQLGKQSMPLVKIWVGPGHSGTDKRRLLDAVHQSVVEGLEVPDDDRTQIIVEHEGMEVRGATSKSFVLVEVFLRPGRSQDLKQGLYERVAANLSTVGVKPSDVLVALYEIPLENWGFPADPPNA